ncbi:CaMKII_AD domain-containing protein [Caenorhabditis elegans]|uniref:CaMKII_AD domain-containing protein n=1 Tax=Caenorhabditis elegans TaxID=6239 RepID=Q564W9_CAEEL|nr:CaMKII_AD domain-containing protein [Caenorhabditis elegans]CAI79238.1 CaMKII_AD domain-containing protein [Caenorhabditis elegans]|eukprot:NP_001023146.1 Uncharacterized protein CELE_F26D10.13 [Caenorhabditis elegans]
MSKLILSLLLVACIAVQINAAGIGNAKNILKSLDKALESHDIKRFLSMHDSNFNFKFCKVSGKSVEDLKKILEQDPNMSTTKKSNHFVTSKVTKDGANYKFDYEEFLLLKNDEFYKAEGTIYFQDAPKVKIMKATEKCPVKIF